MNFHHTIVFLTCGAQQSPTVQLRKESYILAGAALRSTRNKVHKELLVHKTALKE